MCNCLLAYTDNLHIKLALVTLQSCFPNITHVTVTVIYRSRDTKTNKKGLSDKQNHIFMRMASVIMNRYKKPS